MKVVLHLSGPWTALPEVLAGVDGLMASPKAIADKSLARNPVGTGPYKFSQWAAGQQVVVVKDPTYWGTDKAPLDSITFKFVPIEASRVAAYDAGEIDAYTTIYNDTADKAKSSGAQVFSPAPSGYGLTLFNTTKAPLNDARVREALEIGYDRDAVTSAYNQGQGYADAAFSPMVKDSEWWVAPETQPKYDPDGRQEAARRVRQAGQVHLSAAQGQPGHRGPDAGHDRLLEEDRGRRHAPDHPRHRHLRVVGGRRHLRRHGVDRRLGR